MLKGYPLIFLLKFNVNEMGHLTCVGRIEDQNIVIKSLSFYAKCVESKKFYPLIFIFIFYSNLLQLK